MLLLTINEMITAVLARASRTWVDTAGAFVFTLSVGLPVDAAIVTSSGSSEIARLINDKADGTLELSVVASWISVVTVNLASKGKCSSIAQ